MNYDVYSAFAKMSQQDLADIATQIQMLTGVAAIGNKEDAVSRYKELVHANDPKQTRYTKELIKKERERLTALGLWKPVAPDLARLPHGSWFLQFQFTLAKPYISKDDNAFYVSDSVNPVRKDKVFQVPMVAASSWKGVLRWTAMHTRLFDQEWTMEQFAEERFAQAMLFGDEKGLEEESEQAQDAQDFAGYIDGLNHDAQAIYRGKLREHFRCRSDEPLPRHSGRLLCYPTFFDLIGIEVINPHSRQTKAGSQPIYLECAPIGARGTFTLLYVPLDSREADDIREQAEQDLATVTETITEVMLTYGFSAKRTSGFGTARDEITELVVATRAGTHHKDQAHLSKLAEEVAHVQF
ncbi:MAG: CRISPR-associated protein [Chloroflexi bacterium]|nr:CRISPR-associated protein [Chloroflexota bacterium]